jgi:ABC-type nitrate/sulfonate/bicarbonate transport system permease component
MRPTYDLLALMLMAICTFAFIGFVVYKFMSYLRKESAHYHGQYRRLLKNLFDDKFRLN